MTIDENINSNLSAVLYGPGDLRMEHTAIEEPGEGEVQINIRATGICGSDLHYYHHGRIGSRILTQPMILGHESAGIVTKVGKGPVNGLSVGDRVVIEPGRSCHECDRCQEGRYNLCPSMKFSASLLQGPNHGLLREYVCFPAYLCHKMPDNMTYEQGALIEPLAVAVHAIRRTTQVVKSGSCVAVIGAGPIGLLVAAAAFAQGATRCVIFDINPSRLAFAKTYLPAIEIIELPKKLNDDVLTCLEWAQQLVENTLFKSQTLKPEMIDCVYECTGVEASIGLAMHLVRRGGIVMLIGMGTSQCMMPIDLISTREIDVLGNFRYSHAHQKAIDMVSQGKISTEGLVSHRFALKDTLDAFQLVKRGNEGVIKVQIGSF